VLSGIYKNKGLVEIVELSAKGGSAMNSRKSGLGVKNHPFFIASQFHPEFKSKPDKVHPLFREFIKAALQREIEGTQDTRHKTQGL